MEKPVKYFHDDELHAEGRAAPSLALTLLDASGIDLAPDDRRFLSGPFLLANRIWDAVPDWLFEQARHERFLIVNDQQPLWIVGPSELSLFMLGAIVEDPNPPELAELFQWATVAALTRRFPGSVGVASFPDTALWRSMKRKPIEDNDVLREDGRLFETYRTVAGELRHAVIAEMLKHEERARKMREEQTERALQRSTYRSAYRPAYNSRRHQDTGPTMFDLIPGEGEDEEEDDAA